jgi:hypothetical protein
MVRACKNYFNHVRRNRFEISLAMEEMLRICGSKKVTYHSNGTDLQAISGDCGKVPFIYCKRDE